MKKILFVLILFSLSATSLFAFQSGEFRLYPTFGIGMSNASGKAWSGAQVGEFINGDSSLFKNAESKQSLCWNFGASFDYFFNESLALTSGLLYESKPFKVVYPKNTAAKDLELTGNFKFLTIPLGVKYYIGMFFFGGGAYYSLFLSNNAEVKYGSSSSGGDLENTKNDLGIFVDLGMNFNITDNTNLLVFGRYQRGLVNVYEENDMLTNIKMTAITLNISYGIKF